MELIDRDALYDALNKAEWLDNGDRDNIALELVSSRPAVDVPRWIPCSERLPTYNCLYLVTRKVSDPYTDKVYIGQEPRPTNNSSLRTGLVRKEFFVFAHKPA